MTDVYLHFRCTHYGLYGNAPVSKILKNSVCATNTAALGETFENFVKAQLAGTVAKEVGKKAVFPPFLLIIGHTYTHS